MLSSLKDTGGNIDGVGAPTLRVKIGDTVRITLINGDAVAHDLEVEGTGARTERVSAKGETSNTSFRAREVGEIFYYCTVSGHRVLGMEGRVVAEEAQSP